MSKLIHRTTGAEVDVGDDQVEAWEERGYRSISDTGAGKAKAKAKAKFQPKEEAPVSDSTPEEKQVVSEVADRENDQLERESDARTEEEAQALDDNDTEGKGGN